VIAGDDRFAERRLDRADRIDQPNAAVRDEHRVDQIRAPELDCGVPDRGGIDAGGPPVVPLVERAP
jgi:hypothetical protein